MCGRGNFSEARHALVSHIFSTVGLIDKFNGGGKVKVILQDDLRGRAPTPTFCNTPDSTYVALCPLREGDKIVAFAVDHVYYFKSNYLYKSVDLREKCGPHYHFWQYADGVVYRVRHDKDNFFTDLSDEDLYYVEQGRIFAEKYENNQ